MANREMWPFSPTRIPVNITFSNPDGPEDTTAFATVNGQTWVNSSSVILVGFGGVTNDHGPDDALVEGLTAYVENIIPGQGFTVSAKAPTGTWGTYLAYAVVII